MARRPYLHALAERYGILPSYIDQEGRRHETTDASYVALLAALGVDGSSERAARGRLVHDDARAAGKLVAPVVVEQATATRLALNAKALPGEARQPIEWELKVGLEDGTRRQARGTGAIVRLPADLPPGYHRVRVSAGRAHATAVSAEQLRIVTPRTCVTPDAIIDRRRVFGLLANLYTIRSARNWGFGDCGDLRALLRWSGEINAAFVGVNPLHALVNTGTRISPYNPVSRLFRNILYIDIEAVPELRQSPAARQRIASGTVQRALRAVRAASSIDYEAVLALKLPVLQLLYRAFAQRHRDGATARGRAYRRYCKQQGDALRDFATFEALRAHWSALGRGADWHRWPAAYRDCRSRKVAEFRQRHHGQVDFHCYLQFVLDEQLCRVADTARQRDVPIGMYQDLAIGSAGDGADTWAFRDLFVSGVSVGAPPDDYNAAGQNWSFPPVHPQRLYARGYDYYIRLLRQALQHSGALRIDHVMGMVRQYWIPAGAPASTGAYVRMASDDLFGILALESQRAGALIVGEDLGTVPPELPALLERWGVLSTRVFYFERERGGSYRSAPRYPARALVSANTHDLAPIAGFIDGVDLDLRAALRVLVTAGDVRRARADRARDVRAMMRRLFGAGRAASSQAAPSPAAMRDAIHAFLARTPAALLGIALDDLAAEREPVNVPGVGVERHPNWSRRMTPTLARLRQDRAVQLALRALRIRRWKKISRAR